jgi:uncharacterized protein YndB with AHSA1/START domain
MAGSTAQSDFAVTLPNDLEYVITRSFDAPRELVFEALTSPEHIPHWYGMRGSTLPVCDVDLTVGGRYRFVERSADGTDHPFSGEFREIAPPGRIVYTWVYDVAPFNEHPTVITVVLDEQDGRTAMTCITTCDSKETRDMIVDSGMEHGARQSYDRLDERLQSMR